MGLHIHIAILHILLFIRTNVAEEMPNQNEVFPGDSSSKGLSYSDKVQAIKKPEPTVSAIGENSRNESMSPEELSVIHDYAKNLSHSKGPFVTEHDGKPHKKDGDFEVRRSIIRKARVTSESEILKELLHNVKNNIGDKLTIFQDMEYLVHQYDVAINFVNMGGFDLLLPILLSEDEKMIHAALSILGAAMQGNPDVQKSAILNNVGEHLIKLMGRKSTNLSPVLTALSSYLRNAPEAQEKFITDDGVSLLANILNNPLSSSSAKLKVVNLISDLTVEQEMAKLHPEGHNSDQVQKLHRLFNDALNEFNICKLIPTLLEFEDFDTHLRVITAMNSLRFTCIHFFLSEEIQNRIFKLLKLYGPSSENEGPFYPVIDKELKDGLYEELLIFNESINKAKSDKHAIETRIKNEEL